MVPLNLKFWRLTTSSTSYKTYVYKNLGRSYVTKDFLILLLKAFVGLVRMWAYFAVLSDRGTDGSCGRVAPGRPRGLFSLRGVHRTRALFHKQRSSNSLQKLLVECQSQRPLHRQSSRNRWETFVWHDFNANLP